MKKTPPTRAAFTLIELLVVIAIMGILASVVVFNIANKPGEAKVEAARLQIKLLHAAADLYRADQGTLPTLAQGLDALARKPVHPPIPSRYPPDGYLSSDKVPLDPWNNKYIYLVPSPSGKSFEIVSYGSDNEPGGEGHAADISSLSL